MHKEKLNILIAIESFFDGGAEMFAIRLANELALTQQVYFIEVYPYLSKEKRQLSLLDTKRIRLIQPGQNFIGNWLFKYGPNQFGVNAARDKIEGLYQFFKMLQVKLFIKKKKIAIVNSHSWDSDVFFASFKKELKFNLVVSLHGHYEFLADKRKNYTALTSATLNAVDVIIYTSPEQKKTLDKYCLEQAKRRKIFYGLSMPVEKTVTSYQSGTCLNLVMAARGIKEKGWEEAILAVLQVQKKYPGFVKLNLVGEGECIDYLKIKYHSSAISFLGYQSNVIDIVCASHIGLLPTFYIAESLPNTIIEYLFCGKPVITTNVGAIREMVSLNEQIAGNCINLQDGDVVDSIAAAIETYISNPELVEKNSVIAMQAAEKFTMKNCIEKYLNAFMGVPEIKN